MRALATLIPLSVLCGIATAFVFRRFASGETRQTVNRILAHLMELRLFLDEPRLVWNAQCDLLRENLRLLAQIAVPSLIAAPLLALVMWRADAVYGRAPLRAGEAVRRWWCTEALPRDGRAWIPAMGWGAYKFLLYS